MCRKHTNTFASIHYRIEYRNRTGYKQHKLQNEEKGAFKAAVINTFIIREDQMSPFTI